MAKKIDYATMYTLRTDGRYMGYWRDDKGNRHAIYDRDAEALFNKIQEKETKKLILFNEIAKAWQEEHAERVSYNAAAIYKPAIKQLCDLWGKEPIQNITPAMIQSMLNTMGKQGYARRTVQVKLNAMNQIYDKAIVDGLVGVNPCNAVRIPSGLSVTRRQLPSDKDIETIKRSVDLPFGLFAYFILYSGLRRGELLALKWEDIDFENNTISVNKAIYWEVNQPIIKDTKTEAGNRVVPLLQPLKEHLNVGEGYIFGLPSQTVFRRKWKKYCDMTGINLTPHQLRHAFATICFEAGIEDKDAQQLLGHASVATTRDIYTHIREQRKQQTAQKLNDFVVIDAVKSQQSVDNA